MKMPFIFAALMLATSARLYLRRYAVVPGQRVVIATSGDEGYRTAVDLTAAGVEVARIVDLRLSPDGSLFHSSGGQPTTALRPTMPAGWPR